MQRAQLATGGCAKGWVWGEFCDAGPDIVPMPSRLALALRGVIDLGRFPWEGITPPAGTSPSRYSSCQARGESSRKAVPGSMSTENLSRGGIFFRARYFHLIA